MSDEEFPEAYARDLSSGLKDLHRALIRSEIGEDPVLENSPYTVLFALIGDPRFAWMGVLSQLITRLDEMIANVDERQPGHLAQMIDEAGSLIGAGGDGTGEFRMRHVMALQREPEVGLATGRVRKVLAARPARLD